MRIQEIDQTGVLVHLTPSDCLLLADACRLTSLEHTELDYTASTVYDLAGAHLEALALVGTAQGKVARNEAFLAQWTLPRVRQERAILAGEKEADK